jgi:hypothetical protein
MKHLVTFLLLLAMTQDCPGRSIFRPVDPLLPEISVRWVGDSKKYTLRKYHLEEDSLFQLFDKDYFDKHLLPPVITYRNEPQKNVTRAILTDLIDTLINELYEGKRNFTHFKELQAKDFNFKKANGLLIVKFKNYPFVVKLFMESPDSLVNPFDKGMEPIFFFFMGGVDRHRLGFTRIKNREIIEKRLAQSPWAGKVDIPRKWHWIPKKARWIEITGNHIEGKNNLVTRFPGTYCIVADAIEAERNLSLLNGNDKQRALDICNYLDVWIDPHMKNFMIEKNTGKFVIVDTEHFPTSVGLRNAVKFESYSNWYLYLAGKCWKNAFMQNKWERRHPEKRAHHMNLLEYEHHNRVSTV